MSLLKRIAEKLRKASESFEELKGELLPSGFYLELEGAYDNASGRSVFSVNLANEDHQITIWQSPVDEKKPKPNPFSRAENPQQAKEILTRAPEFFEEEDSWDNDPNAEEAYSQYERALSKYRGMPEKSILKEIQALGE